MITAETEDKRITIVIPVYNREMLVLRCLDSLFTQTWRPLDIIIVDNASSDSTLANVEEWASCHSSHDFSVRVFQEKRRGAAFARQTGLENTRTAKVMFFDSDDVMRPCCVEEVMAAWQRKPEADIVAWPVVIHHASGPRQTHSISGNLLERHLVHSILRTQGHAVKTDYLRTHGGWKGEYRVWDDFELGVRLLINNPVVEGIQKPLADVYPQEISITGTDFSSKAGLWEEALDGIERTIKGSSRSDVPRLLDIVNYRRAILASAYTREHRKDLARPLLGRALTGGRPKTRPRLCLSYLWTRLGLRGAFPLFMNNKL